MPAPTPTTARTKKDGRVRPELPVGLAAYYLTQRREAQRQPCHARRRYREARDRQQLLDLGGRLTPDPHRTQQNARREEQQRDEREHDEQRDLRHPVLPRPLRDQREDADQNR